MKLFKKNTLPENAPLMPEVSALATESPIKALDILGYLMEEVESFGQYEAILSLAPMQPKYTFEDSEGRMLAGCIHPSAFLSLKDFAELAVQAIGFHVLLPGTRTFRIFKISTDGTPLNFRLSWHEGKVFGDFALQRSDATAGNIGESEIPAPKTKKSLPASKKNSRVQSALVVEDNPAFASVLSRFLKRHGISCTFCQNAADALEELTESTLRPAVIICDMHMPGMSGLDFLNRLRSNHEICDIPLIMLSGDESVESKIHAIGGGADAYLLKSEDPRILCAHVSRILLRGKRKEVA